MELEEYERLAPHRTLEFRGTKMIFDTPNRLTLGRAATLFSKEPDTIDWILGFTADDTLLDVGANVGMYTIFAACTRGVSVFAFEPESQNYAVLNRNIHLNGIDNRVWAYCVALSDKASVDRLYLSGFLPGESCHSFGQSLDHHNRPAKSSFVQGCVSSTIDELVSGGAIPVPTHIKIDVDGLEHKIIAGARSTLRDARVRSVLVEINTNLDEHWAIVDAFLDWGFDYSREQVERAVRVEGPSKGVGNYVFRR
ncbi:MAG: FkbM family methyltransferase [Burkholderiales bacterium]